MKKSILLFIVNAFLLLASCSIKDTNILPNQQENSRLEASLKKVVVTYNSDAVDREKELLKNEFIIKEIIYQNDHTEIWLLQPTFSLDLIKEIILMDMAVTTVSIDNDLNIFDDKLSERDSSEDGKDDDESDNDEERNSSEDGKDDDESDNEEERDSSGDGKDDDESDNEEERNSSEDGKDDDESDNEEERDSSGDGKDDDESDNEEERDSSGDGKDDDESDNGEERVAGR